MKQRTWVITGVSSRFGRQLSEQLLTRGLDGLPAWDMSLWTVRSI
jgi:NAD(P)-dependent dehydrogenase (short-subunit alcohol dehydrogenase family)